MKVIKCLFFLLLLVPHFLESLNPANLTDYQKMVVLSYFSFIQTLDIVDEHYSASPCIQCKECQSTLLNHEIFVSYISEKMLKMTLNGVYTIEEMQGVLDELVRLLSNGNVDDMMDFMIKTANEKQLFCMLCGTSTWEHLGSGRNVVDSGAL